MLFVREASGPEVTSQCSGAVGVGGDDELVFCHPQKRTMYEPTFSVALRTAMRSADVEGADRIRAFHDLRRTAITNDVASGSSARGVMSKAGHADMKTTTKRYLHLAGVVFRNEAEALEARMLGFPDKSRQSAVESSTELRHLT
ncbi:MAG TPA: tyrosine-type recombinase/integrase [Gaiellaceae bacterium]|nr:tyrosine-type recombinase/integrase [Gaiellaceae bacterium]